MTNPAGAAIVNAIGPIRQLVQGEDDVPRRYLVIASWSMSAGRAGTGAGTVTSQMPRVVHIVAADGITTVRS